MVSLMGDHDHERIQPALHAVLTGDVGELRAALDADPGAVNLPVGENTMLEWMTQPEGGPPSPEMVRHLLDRGASATIEDATHSSDAAGWAQACDDGSETAATIRALVGAARTG